MKLFIADGGSRFKDVYNTNKKLQEVNNCKYTWQDHIYTGRTIGELFKDLYILMSFYYVDDFTNEIVLPQAKEFLLDSGAFTFMSSNKNKKIDWLDYINEYSNYIIKHDIKYYFELDIDTLVGYEKVLEYRKILESKTNKKCIPVWHKSRGLKEFIKMCDEYDYVAIGGIVTKEIKQTEYKYFTYLLNEAHKRNTRVHGLGFTNLKGLEKYHFDSVDSTSWTAGNRFGKIYKFNGKTMICYDKGKNQRLSDSKKTAIHNFKEWVKFQKYADKNL